MSLTQRTTEILEGQGLDVEAIEDLVAAALLEDLGTGVDVTSQATIVVDALASGYITARQAGVVAGGGVAAAAFELIGAADVEILVPDGASVDSGTQVLRVSGPARGVLTAERTALNLICHLSGIATLTSVWVAAVSGTGAVIRDTRKTTPGMRALEKYAVRAGGGTNHRMGLYDAALVKDNHVVAAGGISQAFALVRQQFPDLDVEVECDTLAQVAQAVESGADLILLDNMSATQMAEAVALTDGRAKLEASGGLTLSNAREVAATGVDYLAVGALTHSAPILDLGLDLVEG